MEYRAPTTSTSCLPPPPRLRTAPRPTRQLGLSPEAPPLPVSSALEGSYISAAFKIGLLPAPAVAAVARVTLGNPCRRD